MFYGCPRGPPCGSPPELYDYFGTMGYAMPIRSRGRGPVTRAPAPWPRQKGEAAVKGEEEPGCSARETEAAQVSTAAVFQGSIHHPEVRGLAHMHY